MPLLGRTGSGQKALHAEGAVMPQGVCEEVSPEPEDRGLCTIRGGAGTEEDICGAKDLPSGMWISI